jgi:hypothetical protein
MNTIPPVVNTNVIRYADFVRVTTGSAVYLFSTAPYDITVPAIDANPFTGLSQLVKVGTAQRDIKSTANETTVTLVGIDTANLALVLGANIKGSQVEMWHGFFDAAGALITTGGTGGLYQYFTGYINSFSISEQWSEEIRGYTGAITVSASSIQLILQNRTAGRYTNDNSWKSFNPTDTSMNRVNFIQTINYAFGQTQAVNSPTPPKKYELF